MPYDKEYYDNNKDKAKIKRWRHLGIKDNDFDLLYQAVESETNCYICGKFFTKHYDKCLDHDHETGEVRYILCRNCNGNLLRGKDKKINQFL
jgi:hypothetical protein